ncbi:uncharacterized protein LOC143292824 [Babylonia areolata]|uniref:uncharacterized protein LOC143292824 n=1 Tax=Babylonia areolata TaxID=304850 RepID=UPI003FD046BF
MHTELTVRLQTRGGLRAEQYSSMEKAAEQDRKPRRLSFKSSRSATLPAGAVLMDQPGEGFFSKIRRSFKIRKKNKFVLQHSLDVAGASGGTNADSLSKSTDSLKKTDSETSVKDRFRAQKASQEVFCAKENVVLVSNKSRSCSSETSDRPSSAENTALHGAASISCDKDQCQGEKEAVAEASAVCPLSEDNNNDRFFEDFDPDYDTLDNIRCHFQKKNSSQVKADQDVAEAETSNASQVSVSQGTDRKEDSSMTNPNTGVSQECQAQSGAHPPIHRLKLSSDSSEPKNTNVRESVTDVSSTEPCGICNPRNVIPAFKDDDLYANAKILKRKQLWKSQELLPAEVNVSPQRPVSSGCMSPECSNIQETESSESVVPPPLPARNYSQTDLDTLSDTTHVSGGLWASAELQSPMNNNQLHTTSVSGSDGVNIKMESAASNSDKKAATLFRRDSAVIEIGPVVILDSDQHSHQGNNYDSSRSDACLKLPCSQHTQTVCASTNREKPHTNEPGLQNPREDNSFKEIEDDLPFIDEDPVLSDDYQLSRTGIGDCTRGVECGGIPNSACKSDTTHVGSGHSTDSKCAGQHSAAAAIPVTPEGAQASNMSWKWKIRNSHKHPQPGQSNGQILEPGSPEPEPEPEPWQSRYAVEMTNPSLSLSQRRSSASYQSCAPPLSAPFPASSACQAASGDPESRQGSRMRKGKCSPPKTRPLSLTLSHQFPLLSGAARSTGENPPPLPALCVQDRPPPLPAGERPPLSPTALREERPPPLPAGQRPPLSSAGERSQLSPTVLGKDRPPPLPAGQRPPLSPTVLGEDRPPLPASQRPPLSPTVLGEDRPPLPAGQRPPLSPAVLGDRPPLPASQRPPLSPTVLGEDRPPPLPAGQRPPLSHTVLGEETPPPLPAGQRSPLSPTVLGEDRPPPLPAGQRPPLSHTVLGEETPPPLPAYRISAPRAEGRNVVSEELPLRRAAASDEDQEARKNRRHTSAVDATRAHSDFLKSMKQLKECGWYWGPLSSEEAVSKLSDKCDGSFLVRDSSSERHLLTISFKYNSNINHTRIEFHKGLFSLWEKPDEHSKAHICQFIEQTVEHSKKGNFIYFQRSPNSNADPLPIQLLYPVSRFYRVPSLQHICRFLILGQVRRDHIDQLPLPQKVKDYLSEKQYYVEMLTED